MALIDNIISYWKMQGDSTDEVTTNDGTDLNATYSTGNGKIDQGVGFAGTGDINFTNNAGLKPTSLTVNLWIKTSDATDQSINENFNESGGPVSGWRFWMSGTTLAFDWGNDTGATLGTNYGRAAVAITGLNDGTFRMITAVYDDSIDTGTIYMDAVSRASYNTYTGGIVYDASTAFQMADGALGKYVGAQDEVGYWSRALSGAEITQLYNAGAGLQYPFASSLKNLMLLGVGV